LQPKLSHLLLGDRLTETHVHGLWS
jgi:hypothetical protein